MADFIPEESIFKFKNAFAAFESKKTGLIKVKQLGGVMRLATKFFLAEDDYLPKIKNIHPCMKLKVGERGWLLLL